MEKQYFAQETLCRICIIEPSEPFVYEVFGWATTEALCEAEAELADDPIVNLPDNAAAILCRLVYEDNDHLSNTWRFEPVEVVELLPPEDQRLRAEGHPTLPGME